jgi:hypothetical protein
VEAQIEVEALRKGEVPGRDKRLDLSDAKVRHGAALFVG